MRNDWKDHFLSSVGRSSRAPFVLASGVVISATVLYQALLGQVTHWVTGWAVYPLLIFCAASVLSKRLHDRGRSGWWSALVILAALVVWPRPTGPIGMLFSAILLWAAIDLGLMPGEAGENRYGPNPLKPRPALADQPGL
jgi:uncharacterized membrane protein YhaH (DUF805 family)